MADCQKRIAIGEAHLQPRVLMGSVVSILGPERLRWSRDRRLDRHCSNGSGRA